MCKYAIMCIHVSNTNNCLNRTPVLGKLQVLEQLFLVIQKMLHFLIYCITGCFLPILFCSLAGSVLGQYA